MADVQLDFDHDSAYEDDDLLWSSFMLPSPPSLVGTKRSADVHDPKTTAQSSTSARDCRACENAGCFNSLTDVRPSKRIASAIDVGAFHTSGDEPVGGSCEPEEQFPDICFEKFCQDCSWETPCNSPSQCDQQYCVQKGHCDQQPCADLCVDPECTKQSGNNDPCFCQSCDVQPCPLGNPSEECHVTQPGLPTSAANAIYCYDSASCSLPHEGNGLNTGLLPFETYPCYLPSHNAMDNDYSTAHTSNAATPPLSCHTPLDSVFSAQPSPAPNQPYTNGACFLNIPAEHCHIDNSCCHGETRACGEDPTAPSEYLDLFQKSLAPVNDLANNFTDFGLAYGFPLQTQSFSPSTSNPMGVDKNFQNPTSGLDTAWMYPNSPYTNPIQTPTLESTAKLDILASAIQNNVLQPENSIAIQNSYSTNAIRTSTEDQHENVCKWQHSPGVLCLAVFDSAETLHKHIKTAHVDNCNHCFCQWEDCESATKDFKQRSKLSRHLLGHAGHRPYACSFNGCDKMFATNQAKANHERTHTGDRPYECKQCGYTTTTYTQLQTHISALHEGKKPHKCRFCDFSCADSSNLSKHERTHQTLRPYRCLHVGCTFKPDCRWENLKRHLRRSGHCPELLVEGGEAHKSYREAVKREIDEFNKREGDGVAGKMSRRKR
ncbi:hypothetical protein DM02DRAFT_641540 [Periconia macrospinosa]|uniref:C2H2-type domain-containing protein n=1 Tax=Periconia macrospinosa TaxID=97972 RepID=A0A2V1DYY9_9PLEO|nr:hypothetical protein DM02DRAFT_641540 [Periconia macrospinosa]